MKDIGGAIVLYSHELELSMEEIEKLLAAKIQNLHNSMREAVRVVKQKPLCQRIDHMHTPEDGCWG